MTPASSDVTANVDAHLETPGEPGTGATTTLVDVDVVIIGAGLSGIGAAYRLKEENPDASYLILEARADLGGTWDLFRYPGIRSDSDMYTLAFPFEPWTQPEAIASGQSILDYLRQTATKFGIGEHICYEHRVTAADFDSADALWTIRVSTPSGEREVRARFLYACSGYYNYDEPYRAEIPGLAEFGGQVIHPQHWPQNTDVSGRRVVIIGSGATAISLAPALAEEGADVTVLQRTPTFVITQPRRDPVARALEAAKVSPQRRHAILRAKNTRLQWVLYQVSRRAPKLTRRALNAGVRAAAGAEHVPSFSAPYDPWDQRMCVVPDGDFFRAIKKGRVRMVTDVIEQVDAGGILTASGTYLPADVVVTATGLAVQLLGGAELSIDHDPVEVSERIIFRGCMLDGVPNFALCTGYINASWGLRADMSHRFVSRVVARLLKGSAALGSHHVQPVQGASVTPRAPEGLTTRPLLEMDSGYMRRAAAILPRRSDQVPWTMRQDVVVESREMAHPSLDEGLEFRYATTHPTDDRPH